MTVPSWISLIRAPAARISSIRSWWRGRSSTIVVMSPALRPNASAIARTLSPTGRSRSIRPRARGPTAIVRMYMSGSRAQRAGLPDDDHRDRPVPAARDDPAALERVEGEVDLPRRRRRPRPAHRRAGVAVARADDDVAVIGSWSSAASMPEKAASSALSWSARPSQRAPASAARSVARR